MKLHFLAVVVASLLTAVIVSCLHGGLAYRRPRLTTENWDILSNTGLHNCYVRERVDEEWEQLFFGDETRFRKLLTALSPLKPHYDTPAVWDYSLNYQAGMDPDAIFVRVNEDHLTFRIGEWVYVGGNRSKFLAAIASSETKSRVR